MKSGEITVKCVKGFDFESAVGAWNYSRPKQAGRISIEDVVSTDLPVNDFPRGVFEVCVPALLREWLVTFRNIVIWSRSTRVDDLSTLPFYSGDLWNNQQHVFDQLRRMTDMQAAGADQDSYRLLLPMSYMADFSMTISFRDFVKLLHTISQEAASYSGTFSTALHQLWQALYYSLDDQTRRLVGKAPVTTLSIPEPPGDEGALASRTGGTFVCRAMMPLNLRAQLVRHRSFSIHDNMAFLYNMFGRPGSVISQDAHVLVEWSGSVEAAEEVLKKRQCWIAHEKLWERPIELMHLATGLDGIMLPCDGGSCPFQLDLQARMAGRDPAPPCPKFAQLTKATPEEFAPFASRVSDYIDNEKPTYSQPFWHDVLRSLAVKETN